MKYLVRVTETLAHTLVVEAENATEAQSKISAAYDDGQITLDYDSFDGWEVEVLRTANDFDCTYYDIWEDEK